MDVGSYYILKCKALTRKTSLVFESMAFHDKSTGGIENKGSLAVTIFWYLYRHTLLYSR